MQRGGRLEVTDAVVVNDAGHDGALEALDGLRGLVVVGQHDELARLDALDLLGLGDADLGEELGGLGGQGAQGAGLVLVAVVVHLVEQLGQDDGAHDGVVVGVLVTKDVDRAH